jgi:hypothetical protein
VEKDARAEHPPRGLDAARAAALRQEAAATRRIERGQIRAALRSQLADIQRHRHELSVMRLATRQAIAEIRGRRPDTDEKP